MNRLLNIWKVGREIGDLFQEAERWKGYAIASAVVLAADDVATLLVPWSLEAGVVALLVAAGSTLFSYYSIHRVNGLVKELRLLVDRSYVLAEDYRKDYEATVDVAMNP